MIHSNYQHPFHQGTGTARRNDSAAEDIRDLEMEVERLSIICEALWELLRERHDLEEIDLIEKMTAIDLKDGKLDGKKDVKSPPIECRRCGRVLMKHRPVCLYCGEVTLPRPFA